MKKLACVFGLFAFVFVICFALGCGGGGGGGSSTSGNDIFNTLATLNQSVSSDKATQIGNLSSDGISLNLAKGALANDSNVTVKQYSDDAAMARLNENFPSLASFTVVSSLYELSAKDKNSKTLTILEVPSELNIAINEDISSNKLYYAVVKQNGEWTLLPLQENTISSSFRVALTPSKSIKLVVNTLYESLFIASIAKKDSNSSKLTYAENFAISVNNSTQSPQTITASYTQAFDSDVEVNVCLTLKGNTSPDKAEVSITAFQKGNKTIGVKNSKSTYKDFNFSATDEAGKYKTTFKLSSDLATSKISENTATYTFFIKAKDVNVSDLPSSLILKASVKASTLFYSPDIQINFEKGPEQPNASIKGDSPASTEADVNQTIVIAFSQKMNTESVEKALSIKSGSKSIEASSLKWNSAKTELTLTLKDLEVNTKHSINIASSALSETGIPLKAFSFSFTTKKYLAGNKASLITPENKAIEVKTDTKVVINFEKAVSFDTAKGTNYVTVKAKNSTSAINATYTLSNSNKTLTINFPNKLDYLTEYSIQILDGIKSEDSRYSNVEIAEFSFTTAERYYTVKYDGNGNTSGAVPTDSKNYKLNETFTIASIGTLQKDNYSFRCWATKADGTGTTYSENQEISISDDITLYAIWDKLYIIRYDGNGYTSGTVPTDNNIYREGDIISVSAIGDLTKDHYYFVGWNTKADGTGITVSQGNTDTFKNIVPNSDFIKLYAIWKKSPVCRIVYNGNGNTTGSVPIDENYYEMKNTVTYCNNGIYTTYYPTYTSTNEELINKTITIVNQCNLTKSGLGFSHWNTKSDGSGTNIFMDSISIAVTNPEKVIYTGSTNITEGNPLVVGDSNSDKDKVLTLYAIYDQYSTFAGGDGSSQNPYWIETVEQLKHINVNNNLDKHFKQIADIDLSEINDWIPIGIIDDSDWGFKGSYDGNGKKIRNLTCNTEHNKSMGLFGRNDGTISNLVIDNFSFTKNSTNNGHVGGIAKDNYGKIINCRLTDSSIIINTSHNDREYVGGITGYNQNIVDSCYVKNCNINVSNDNGSVWVGGICGVSSIAIINSCYLINTNIIGNGNSDSCIGGICGSSGVCRYYDDNLISLYAISSCYVSEDSNHSISKEGDNGYLGIIVGHLYNSLALYGEYGTISDCFYTNELPSGTELIGFHGDINSPTSIYEERGITNCYYGIKDYNAFKGKIWTTEKNLHSADNYSWSDEAWANFNISESNWPPTLKEQ